SFGKAFAEESEASYTESYSDSFKGFSDFAEKREEPYETSHRDSPFKDFMNDSKRDSYTKRSDAGPSYHASGTAALRRTDPGIYRKLYGQNKKGTYGSSYAGAYHGPHQAEIEDNRATVLAVKIIKQAIACFAILGILVLMQQRTDMGQALAFVKKQVIEINVDPQSILSGVEDLVKQCTKFLGGSP
ncbi:MAG: hypothetical protein N2376_07110, partial [Clostridia bacterium]|nr:hypothetical protein [Clostridia bacterium]